MGLIPSLLRLRGSFSIDVNAATLPDGHYRADKHILEDGLTAPLAQDVLFDSGSVTALDIAVVSSSDSNFDIKVDTDEASSSDSDSDSDLDVNEDELEKIGEGIWVQEDILAKYSEPKDMDIICYYSQEPGKCGWWAIAPEVEFTGAVGSGSSMEEAAKQLQSMLEGTKLRIIEQKMVEDIKRLPLKPCIKHARKARMGYNREGHPNELQKAHYDEDENKSSAVVWSKIRI